MVDGLGSGGGSERISGREMLVAGESGDCLIRFLAGLVGKILRLIGLGVDGPSKGLSSSSES